MNIKKIKTKTRAFLVKTAGFLFWAYHSIYLLFLAFAGYELVSSSYGEITDILTFDGFFPPLFVALIYVAILMPLFGIILTLRVKRIRKSRARRLTLFFGVEIPIMGLVVMWLILVRQPTPAVILMMLSVLISIVGLLVHLVRKKIRPSFQLGVMFSQQAALTIAGYIFLLGLFFLPIIVAGLLEITQDAFAHPKNTFWFIRSFSYRNLFASMLEVIVVLFFSSSFALFVSVPFIAAGIFLRTAAQAAKTAAKTYGQSRVKQLRFAFSITLVVSVVLLAHQSRSQRLYNIAKDLSESNNFDLTQELGEQILEKEAAFKKELSYTYLSPYRYVSDNEMNLLAQGYMGMLDTPRSQAKTVQNFFNKVTLPFTYQGNFDEDVEQATNLYQAIFDQTIQAGEKETITKALQKTNVRDSLKAGTLDEGKETVQLAERVVSAHTDESGLLATVTIEEEFHNTSDERQEVVYEFSLPNDAVVTDLLLGPDLELDLTAAPTQKPIAENPPTPDPTASTKPTPTPSPQSTPQQQAPEIHVAQVAPKGAAEQTFDEQILRRLDPALLQQTGPRQYKLRVFPIPTATRRRWNNTRNPQANQKIRYTYVTFVGPQGIALPNISLERNLFTDKNSRTTLYLNGQIQDFSKDSNFISLAQHSCEYPILSTSSTKEELLFVPHNQVPSLSNLASTLCQGGKISQNIENKRIALLLDTSYSSKGSPWLEKFKESSSFNNLLAQNEVDLLRFNNSVSTADRVSTVEDIKAVADRTTFVGQTDRLGALNEASSEYDLILLFTDSGVNDIEPEEDNVSLSTPAYLIHHDHIPSFHDALTTAVVQSNGEVVTSIDAALEDYSLTQEAENALAKDMVLEVNRLGSWVKRNEGEQLDINAASPGSTEINKLAINAEIFYELRLKNQTELEDLDALNTQATRAGIVTPYSSLIALVDERQQEQLRNAMKQDNRYQAVFNNDDDALADPSGAGLLATSGVPEPEEWLLMALGAGLLMWLYRQQLRANFLRLTRNVSS